MAEGGVFVYISSAGSRQIQVLRLAPEKGELTRVQQVSVTGKVYPLALAPDRRFLYAALRTRPYSIASFAIDGSNGTLTHLANAPAADSLPYICADRAGRFLLAAANPAEPERRTGLISVSAIGQQGFAQPPHQVIRIGPKAHAILPDPSNRYVFATSCDGDQIWRHRFDAAAGTLSEPLAPVIVSPKSGPRHFVFHPNNRFLYLLNEYDGSIYTYAFDADSGALAELQTVSALPPDTLEKGANARAADLHLTPDGRFLYASVRTTVTLAAFRVDLASGLLAPAGHFPAVKEPRGFNIDPYGRYLLAAGTLTGSVASYRINQETGDLTRLEEYPLGEEPNWIEVVRLP